MQLIAMNRRKLHQGLGCDWGHQGPAHFLQPPENIRHLPFSTKEVEAAIKTLRIKATGVDALPAKILKQNNYPQTKIIENRP